MGKRIEHAEIAMLQREYEAGEMKAHRIAILFDYIAHLEGRLRHYEPTEEDLRADEASADQQAEAAEDDWFAREYGE